MRPDQHGRIQGIRVGLCDARMLVRGRSSMRHSVRVASESLISHVFPANPLKAFSFCEAEQPFWNVMPEFRLYKGYRNQSVREWMLDAVCAEMNCKSKPARCVLFSVASANTQHILIKIEYDTIGLSSLFSSRLKLECSRRCWYRGIVMHELV